MKLELGKWYLVYFYDHCRGGGDVVKCIACGKLIATTNKKIVLCYWEINSEDEELINFNREKMTIVKSAIYRISELSPH